MSGTPTGGKLSAQKNLANNPNFYKEIGAKGGRNGTTGGFAANVECGCAEITGIHMKRKCAGIRGGRVSRRGLVTNTKVA